MLFSTLDPPLSEGDSFEDPFSRLLSFTCNSIPRSPGDLYNITIIADVCAECTWCVLATTNFCHEDDPSSAYGLLMDLRLVYRPVANIPITVSWPFQGKTLVTDFELGGPKDDFDSPPNIQCKNFYNQTSHL